jgi:lipid II isoglutaminyl synthase (glutamine-hydrolysing)
VKLTICHLYSDLMNIYGDRGNIIALAQRARWRGIEAEVVPVGIGDALDPDSCDVVFFGGGQDKEQLVVADDLRSVQAPHLHRHVEEGGALLSICGGYQLLGKYFRTHTGETLEGISLFDAWTVAGNKRFIGNSLVEGDFFGVPRTIVGFENHSGRTYLGPGVRPMARVLVGFGNNGEDKTEGAIYRNAFGCYLHGSLLPKNPWFTDHLILTALRRRYGSHVELEPLDDGFEERAHQTVAARARKLGRVDTGVT